MAASVPAVMVRPVISESRSCLSFVTAPSKASSSNSGHLSCHQNSWLQFGKKNNLSSARNRILHVVKAKKETFSSLDEMLANSDKPVLVDFYATWCGPCQFMVPILDKVSAVMKDKIQVVKIDTEKYPSIADKYRIEALPTFIVFSKGKPLARFEGAFPADEMIQRIESSLEVKQ